VDETECYMIGFFGEVFENECTYKLTLKSHSFRQVYIYIYLDALHHLREYTISRYPFSMMMLGERPHQWRCLD